MRGRIVLFVTLAVAAVLAIAYLGLSAGAPKAAGRPPTTTSSPTGSAYHRTPGTGLAHAPAAPAPQTGPKMGSPAPPAAAPPAPASPKAHPPKGHPPKAHPPKAHPSKAHPPAAVPPKACSSTAAAQPPASTSLADPPSSSATGPVHFGQVSMTSFDDSAQISMSGDYQALTAGFSKLEIAMGKNVENGSGECDVARSLSMTLPVTGPARGGQLGFYVQGYAWTDGGASAQLTVRGNGQVKVQRFPARFDDSFLLALEFPVTPGASYTLSVQLEVHQNPGTGGNAYLNISTIDSQVAEHL